VRGPDALIQPVAATEVAAKLTGIAVAAPADGVVEFGGPQHLPFAEFIGTALQSRTLVADDDAARAVIRFRDWLAGR
jgi:hypothetical protein